MIGYHLLSARWALEALRKRRMKLALLEDMNDPFELLGVDLARREDRLVFQKLKADMHTTIGVLCFSRSWNNPVLWSHYADRHRGICLGFELLDDWICEVQYSGKRIKSDIEKGIKTTPDGDIELKLLTTKFEHWRYEDEVRIILKLEDVVFESDHYFLPFCNALRLKEIVLGPRCDTAIRDVEKEVAAEKSGVSIVKARLAFRSFKVVRNKMVGSGTSGA